MQNQFMRTQLLLGPQAMERLANTRVAVVGVGGVGSFTAEALARSGVGSLLLIDDDTVAQSNINRQIHATTKTVGQPKVEVMAQRLIEINPHIQVDPVGAFVLPDTITTILDGTLDYIVDAVDTVTAKLALVEYAAQKNIPIISVMGAGNKLDPTRFVVGDLYETDTCPLCRVMRRELRRKGIDKLEVVYSTEPAMVPAPSLSEDPGIHQKRQTPGSISFVPSVAGLIAASVVVRKITGFLP